MHHLRLHSLREANVIETLAQIKAPHFTAGLVLQDDLVVEAAPIIGYMKKNGWSRSDVRNYCREKGWTISVVREETIKT